MSTDHFDRHYLYYIRYTYGLEGCRKARKGFSCSRLIANNPTTTDRHGCPFKHWNKQELTKKLSDYGLSQPSMIIKNHFLVTNIASLFYFRC